MSDRRLATEIENAATEWLVRVERGLSDHEQAAFDNWLDGDTRNMGAYVRAQAAWIHAERASALGAMPQSCSDMEAVVESEVAPSRPLGRRAFLAGGGAVVASIVGGAFLVIEGTRTIESSIGEIRRLALVGGTALTLDTDSRVEIVDGSGDRLLKLRRGKVFLDVLRGARPLVVQAGGLALQMGEGAFTVQMLAEGPLVALVTNGRLSVSQDGGMFGKKRYLTVADGHALTLARGAPLTSRDLAPIPAEQREQLLAWRDGMLAFGGDALENAVRAFDRYGPVRIVVTDPTLAREKITGLFRADDPRGFAAAIAASFGATAEVKGNYVHIHK